MKSCIFTEVSMPCLNINQNPLNYKMSTLNVWPDLFCLHCCPFHPQLDWLCWLSEWWGKQKRCQQINKKQFLNCVNQKQSKKSENLKMAVCSVQTPIKDRIYSSATRPVRSSQMYGLFQKTQKVTSGVLQENKGF